MALRIIFNPLSGRFDYIDVTDTSVFARPVPTLVAEGDTFVVGDNTQALWSEEITINGDIEIGDNAVLVEVD